jgi:hypothetical protein
MRAHQLAVVVHRVGGDLASAPEARRMVSFRHYVKSDRSELLRGLKLLEKKLAAKGLVAIRRSQDGIP